MTHLWKIGDLAVCVDDSPRHYTHDASILGTIIKRGQVYRVVKVCIGAATGRAALVFARVKAAPATADRFRPILPADTAFTEQMRALKPRVEA